MAGRKKSRSRRAAGPVVRMRSWCAGRFRAMRRACAARKRPWRPTVEADVDGRQGRLLRRAITRVTRGRLREVRLRRRRRRRSKLHRRRRSRNRGDRPVPLPDADLGSAQLRDRGDRGGSRARRVGAYRRVRRLRAAALGEPPGARARRAHRPQRRQASDLAAVSASLSSCGSGRAGGTCPATSPGADGRIRQRHDRDEPDPSLVLRRALEPVGVLAGAEIRLGEQMRLM